MKIRDLAPPAALESGIGHYGTIAKGATDFTDLLPVILPEFDPHQEWGPCRWQSRDATSLPAKGDACLVIFDNRREPWIAAWWPF
jgi:hypothetical protein